MAQLDPDPVLGGGLGRGNQTRDTLIDLEIASSHAERDARFGPLAPATARHRMLEVGDLSEMDVAKWVELRRSNPALDSATSTLGSLPPSPPGAWT